MAEQQVLLKHRKMHPGFLIGCILFFAFIYAFSNVSHTHEGRIAYAVVAVAFNAYFLLLVTSIDSVAIDCLSRTVHVERRIGPFRKEHDIDANEFKFVSIFNFGGAEGGNYYEIGLKKEEKSEPIRLLATYFFFDAWKKTVIIAQCLNLPVYDTIWPSLLIWKPEKIPKDRKRRKEVLRHQVGKEKFLL